MPHSLRPCRRNVSIETADKPSDINPFALQIVMCMSRDIAVHLPVRKGDVLQPTIYVEAEILVSAVVFVLQSVCHFVRLCSDSLQHSNDRASGVPNAHDAAQPGTNADKTQLLILWEHTMCLLYEYLARIIEPDSSVYEFYAAVSHFDGLEEGCRC